MAHDLNEWCIYKHAHNNLFNSTTGTDLQHVAARLELTARLTDEYEEVYLTL